LVEICPPLAGSNSRDSSHCEDSRDVIRSKIDKSRRTDSKRELEHQEAPTTAVAQNWGGKTIRRDTNNSRDTSNSRDANNSMDANNSRAYTNSRDPKNAIGSNNVNTIDSAKITQARDCRSASL
jgi:hypothetical protein